MRREGTLEDDATTTAPSRAVILWPAAAVHAGGRRRIGLHARAASLLLLYMVVSREATSRGERVSERVRPTLLYRRISRTRLQNASSTLMRCLAEVSRNLAPKCFARSRPSTIGENRRSCQ